MNGDSRSLQTVTSTPLALALLLAELPALELLVLFALLALLLALLLLDELAPLWSASTLAWAFCRV
jgi:hypothetical protein